MVYLPPTVPSSRRAALQQLVSDVELFAKLHRVQEKESKVEVPFDPLPMQQKIFAAVKAGHKRICVLKARQVAATTGCKMVLHHLAYTTEHAAMHAVVSMRADSAISLLDDHRRWLNHPPKSMQRQLDVRAKGEIVYGETGAGIKAFTSRSTTGLRSYAPTAVLISEFAYAPDQDELLAQALAAVGEGLLIVESTANVPNDAFSRLIEEAPENGWHLVTMWWWEHPAYCDPPENIEADFIASLDDGEKQLITLYNLSTGQLHWRRRQVATLGEHKFRREYPACLDDCFLSREGGYFDELTMQGILALDFHAVNEDGAREVEAPVHTDRYVMGVDVGGGVGGDFSTIAVVSVATRQPVYFVRSNRLTPAAWAHKVIQVASRYNNALVLAESNNHGHALILELDNCGYRYQWRHPKTHKPWITTLQSKLEVYDVLREALPIIKVMDRVTWMELRALTILPGKFAPEAPQGSHDDSSMALALAYKCLTDVPSAWRGHTAQASATRVESLIQASRARRIRASALPF